MVLVWCGGNTQHSAATSNQTSYSGTTGGLVLRTNTSSSATTKMPTSQHSYPSKTPVGSAHTHAPPGTAPRAFPYGADFAVADTPPLTYTAIHFAFGDPTPGSTGVETSTYTCAHGTCYRSVEGQHTTRAICDAACASGSGTSAKPSAAPERDQLTANTEPVAFWNPVYTSGASNCQIGAMNKLHRSVWVDAEWNAGTQRPTFENCDLGESLWWRKRDPANPNIGRWRVKIGTEVLYIGVRDGAPTTGNWSFPENAEKPETSLHLQPHAVATMFRLSVFADLDSVNPIGYISVGAQSRIGSIVVQEATGDHGKRVYGGLIIGNNVESEAPPAASGLADGNIMVLCMPPSDSKGATYSPPGAAAGGYVAGGIECAEDGVLCAPCVLHQAQHVLPDGSGWAICEVNGELCSYGSAASLMYATGLSRRGVYSGTPDRNQPVLSKCETARRTEECNVQGQVREDWIDGVLYVSPCAASRTMSYVAEAAAVSNTLPASAEFGAAGASAETGWRAAIQIQDGAAEAVLIPEAASSESAPLQAFGVFSQDGSSSS